ncbi:hypothetical protein L6R52_03695 [Myxococcota bacterium]|nr:hypothetical protein [Myxococcota bacterium]
MRALAAVLVTVLVPGVAAAQSVDHRGSQSPVKDQNPRGTCAAFAIAAALETKPGVPTDLSEQFLYALVKKTQLDREKYHRAFGLPTVLDEGDGLQEYSTWFSIFGAPHDRYLPYTAQKMVAGSATPTDLERFLVLAQVTPDAVRAIGEAYGKYGIGKSELLGPTAVQDVERLKWLLRAGVVAIPVGYTIHGKTWSLQQTGVGLPDPKRPVFTPQEMELFAPAGTPAAGKWLTYREAVLEVGSKGRDLVTEVRAGRWQTRILDTTKDAYGGHAMTIVGFDDRGFLLKNSWSADWGDRGYAIVSYDFHRLYASQGLLITEARVKIPSLDPFARKKLLAESELRLKVQPIEKPLGRLLNISGYSMAMRDASIDAVQYGLHGRDAAGTWTLVRTFLVDASKPGTDALRASGFPIELSGPELAALESRYVELRIEAAYAFDPLISPAGLITHGAARELTFGPFPAKPTQLLDLVGR